MHENPSKMETIYAAAVMIEGSPGEVIFVANHRDQEGNVTPRATVETHDWAIPSLVECADAVVEGLEQMGHKATYRLLQFNDPVEIDPELYREGAAYSHRIGWRSLMLH